MVFTFMTAISLVGALYFFLVRRNVFSKRLAKFLHIPTTRPSSKLLEDEPSGLAAKINRLLYEPDSPSEAKRKKALRTRLIQAGFRSKKAYRNFLSIRIMLGVLMPSIYILYNQSLVFSTEALLTSCILLAGGYSLPSFILSRLKGKRQERIFKGLPDALDLMNICVAAGLGLDMTFKRVGEELRVLWKDLSSEFHLTNLEIRAGKSREEGYKNMALRTGVSEVKSLMGMLIQTSRFGTSVSAALRVHSDGMRTKRRQLAEERAAKVGVKMTLPLILFIFPALLVVLVGPAGIKIIKILFPSMGGGG